jgi:EmrB/QacA subfamily drug resistance transporter
MGRISSIPYKWLALFTVAVGSFSSTLDASIVTISFPRLTKAFAVETSAVLWVTVVYLLVSVSLMLSVGKLGDVLGRKKIYAMGSALFTIGLAFCSLSQSISQLILSRMLQGVGAAMIISLGTAIVTAAFPTAERGKAVGLLGAVISAGLLSGPLLGGFLLDLLDWRAIFYTRIPISIIGTVMACRLLKEQTGRGKEFFFDWLGAVLLCAFLTSLILFFNLGGKRGYGSAPAAALAGAAILLLALFIFQERRATEPTVDLGLFKDRVFACANLSLGFMFFALGFYTFLMPFYLIDGLGYSAWHTGLTIAVVSVTTLVVAPVSGSLSDRIGTRLLCTAGITLICIALLLISRLDLQSSTADVVLRLVLFGVGSGLFQSPNNSSILGAAPRDRLGTASAMLATIRQIGISLGVAASGTLFAGYRASFAAQLAESSADPSMIGKLSLVSSFQDTLVIAFAICSIGIVTSLARGKGYSRRP